MMKLKVFPALLLLGGAVVALPVSVTSVLVPPYPPHLSDYTSQPNKLLVTVQSQPGSPVYKVKLAARIIGVDNTILIYTDPAFQPAQPLVLQPGVPRIVSVADLGEYFSTNHLVFQNITKQQVAQGDGLPEGVYRICIRAYDYDTGEPLSDPEPVGCTGPFPVKSVEPPVFTNPLDNAKLVPATPQAQAFSWTLPPGAPPLAEYTLKIVELVPRTRDPYDAINSATQPPFFEGKTTVTSLLFGPAQPQLKAGSRYAARVTVRDPQNKLYFKNKGQSPVIAFDYGTAPGYRQFQPQPHGPGGHKAAKFFAVSTVKGRLSSTFAAGNVYGLLGRARPLGNTPVKLVLYYVFYKPGTKTVAYYQVQELAGHFPGAGQTLATAVTDAAGNFQFTFVPPDSMGLIAKDTLVKFTNKEQFYSFKGDLYRVARLIVESPYYTSPDNDIAVAPLQALDIGALFAYARDYSLTVTMMPSNWQSQAQYTQGPLSGIVVYILRKNRPAGVPDNEGEQPDPPMSKEGMQVVGVDTTDNNGRARFSWLVKNVNLNDKYYICAESDPKGDKNYVMLKSAYLFNMTSDPPPGGTVRLPIDSYTFNSERKPIAAATTRSMHPLQPEITGYVYRADNPNTPVSDAKVVLLNYAVLFWPREASTLTDGAGRFSFGALKLNYDSLDRVSGPIRAVRISRAGFRDTTFLVPPASAKGEMVPLRLGQRYYIPKLLLQPDAEVTGTVVDENGSGVNSKVVFPGGDALTARSMYINIKTGKWAPAAFSGWTASGKNQQVIIDPDNGAFFTETAYVDIAKGSQTLAPFKVYRREHRIRVVVTTAPRTGPAQPIKDARVTVEGVGTKSSNDVGIAEFRFAAATDSFTVTARTPEGGDYITRVRNVKAPLAKTFKTVPCSLRLGVHVSGHVYAGQSPVESARVWLADAGSPGVQTYTGADGAYYIAAVPRHTSATFRAAKSKSNFVGDSAVISTADSRSGVDFHLSVYEDMDISRLLGFPIEVATIEPVAGGARISGAFGPLPPNPQFRAQDSLAVLGFDSVTIVPGPDKNPKGVPYAVPKSGSVTTMLNNLALRVNGLAGAVQDNALGVRVAPFAGAGAVRGRVFLSGASFTDPGLSLGSGLWLGQPDSGSAPVPTITSTGSQPFPGAAAFPARPASGKAINYSLHGFPVTADTAGTRLAGTTLTLAGSVLHTAFANITPADARIAVGAVAVQPDKVLPLTGGPPISLPIEKWTLQGDSWTFTSAGLILNKGKVKTGVVDVPFTAVEIKPAGPAYGSYQLKDISIGGIIPLNVLGKTAFGWDPGKNHWALSVVPDTGSTAAWFGGLPGMGSGDRVRVNNFFLLSSGEAEFTVLPKPITLYKVASFTPTGITAYSTYVHLPGIIDVDVPLVPASPAAIDYSKPGGVMKFGLQSFPIKFASKGVIAEFKGDPAHPQTLDEKGFLARGRVYETDLWGLEVTLFRTVESTATWVVPKESLNVDAAGQRKLRNVVGNMRVVGGDWTNFTFSGDLVGATGATSYLTFVVKGEVEASGQQVAVKNIPSPFGGINLGYDFANHRLFGSLHFDRTLQGGTEVKSSGDAEVLVDGDGWYFLAAGTMRLPSEGKEGQAAMIFGSYPMNSHIKTIFQQNSFVYQEYGTLPAIFPNEVAGFYFEAMAAMPIPIIPSGEFDFGLIHGVLKHQVGADMRLSMQFSNAAIFGIGQSAFAKIWVGLGGSVVIACAGVSAEVKTVISWDGQYATNGNWFVDGDGHLVLTGETYVGAGLCNSNCESIAEIGGFGTPCVKHSEDGKVKLGVHGHAGSDYKKLEFYWE
jgi:TANFOR domain-containing protein